MLWLLSCTSLASCPSSSTRFMPTMIWGNWCLFIIHFFLSWNSFFLDFRSIHWHFFILNLNQKTLYKIKDCRIQAWPSQKATHPNKILLIMLTPSFLGFYFTAIDLRKLLKLLVVSKEEILLWFIGPNPWKASLICV